MDRVDRTKMLVLGQGIAKSGTGNVAAAIMGVEPGVEASSSPLAGNMVEGSYINAKDNSMVVVGCEMAKRLNLKVGKKMVIATNDVQGQLVEELCRVKGIFRTGSDEMDAYFIQMPIDFARRLFRMPRGSATQIGFVLKDPADQAGVIETLKSRFQGRPVAVLPWQEVLPEVASYIQVDKGSNLVFQGILLFIILFTIFNTMLMSVLERKREFAMLLALGTDPSRLRLQVFIESVFLALIGCFLGMILGGLAGYAAQVYGIDLSALMGESFNISGFALSSKTYAKLTAGILFGTSGIVFFATVVLSLIPMRHATRVPIVETLR
jgi:ABC-type lipoprotein release transport system permease subunit